MHGYGIYKFACGAKYSGEWANGKADGKVITRNLNYIYIFLSQFLK